MFNVLFLCTGNSARSIMAEATLNGPAMSRGVFTAYSAGSHPKPHVHPLALETLAGAGLSVDGYRSKSWDEFAAPGAPVMDFVFTVCDNAANEACPFWPGQPMTAHWGMPDPAAVKGPEAAVEKAFRDTLVTMQRRIQLMLSLPLASLDKLAIQREIKDIGKR